MRKTKTLLLASIGLALLTQGCKKSEPITQIKSLQASKKRVLVDEVSDVTLAQGAYKFVTWNTWNNSTNKALRPVGGVTAAEDALVEQRGFTTNHNGHEWVAVPAGGGDYYLLTNNWRVLTVLGTGTPASGNSLGVKVIGWNDSRQKWKITYIGLGTYKIKLSSNTALAVNITPTGSVADGAVFKLGGTADLNSSFLVYRMAIKDDDFTNFFKRDDATGWNAGDGTNSVSLSNGKVLWIMDDSNISTFSGGTITCNQAMVNNAGLLQTKDNWTTKPATLLGAGNTSWVKSQPGTTKYNWLTGGFQHGDTVYIYGSTLDGSVSVGPPVFAKYKVSTNAIVGYKNLSDYYRTDLDAIDGSGAGKISFGRGFATVTDGGVEYIYAYGTHVPYINANIYVARFPKTVAGINGAWTFWNGSTWVSDHYQAVSIGTATTTVPFVSKVNDKYVLVSTELSVTCGNGSKVYTSGSTSPTGPFPAMKAIYTIDDVYGGNVARFYWGIAHPEYLSANNELLITYNVNSDGATCGVTCSSGRKDPNIYRPRGIRVPMKLIDATW